MRVWLLQSRRGGRTCGHLQHVRESGAWRCRDVQSDPAGWSVVSTWLSEPEGARPKVDWGWIAVGAAMLLLVGGATVAVLVWSWIVGNAGLAVVAAVVAAFFGLLTASTVRQFVDDYRNPSSWSGGWDWF